MDSPPYNKYNSSSARSQVRLVKRHHPLEGQDFDVIRVRGKQVDVRLADGSSMRVPRQWTNVDGPPPSPHAERVFTLEALLEVIELVSALRRRP